MSSIEAPQRAASAEREVQLSPEQALQLAIERHRAGQLDEAEMVYQALLDRWPEHPELLNHMGMLQCQRDNHPRALALLQRAVELEPGAPGTWNNLGNVLLRTQQCDEAERAFRRSIAIEDNPQARSNLGRVLRRRKCWREGEAECLRAIELAPDFADAWHNLALLLIGSGRIDEGVRAATKALTLMPAYQRRRDSYTRALVMLGEFDQAAAIFREWLAEEPDNPYVRHHLAACGSGAAPARASDAYVEQVFDNFASRFDAKLAYLEYRAPEFVAEALRQMLPAPAAQFDIADLGCGTGLCGPLVRPWARHLSGCDLSAAMLERARQRGCYDAAEKAELVAYLRAHPQAFDVVISADTLCYFGDLGPVADAARQALRAGGHLVFTVEALEPSDAAGYRLRPNGRYAHAPAYLNSVLADARLQPKQVVARVLRQEGGEPVAGWLVAANCDGGTR